MKAFGFHLKTPQVIACNAMYWRTEGGDLPASAGQ